MENSKIAWLTGRAFHDAPIESLQIATNWTTFFCLLDDRIEQSDRSPLSLASYFSSLVGAFNSGFGEQTDVVVNALLDIRRGMMRLASPSWVSQFGKQLEDLLTAFSLEAIHRHRQITPDIGTYKLMRETTVGLYPHFQFMSMMRGVALPLEIRRQPLIRRLEKATCNMVGWANDIYTYEKELQASEMNNLVFSLRDGLGLSLTEALSRAVEMHNEQVCEFIRLESQLPDFWAWANEVRCYVGMLRSWVRGHLDWAVETGRYRPDSGQPLNVSLLGSSPTPLSAV